jgi:cysteine synthase B
MNVVTRAAQLNAMIDISADLKDQIGDTPLIRLSRVTSHLPEAVQVLAKAEWFNPSGSVKDRPAWGIIHTALESGDLEPGKVLLDATSGNMGIAYATFCAALGIPCRLALPENATQERIAMLQALDAYLIFTDPTEGSDGAREVAAQLAEQHPERYFFADQYSNPANWQAHYRTTGPELVEGTNASLTHFVAGLGTSGTMTGAGRFLRENTADIELIAVQPDSPLHGLEGLKHLESSHVPAIYDPGLVDRTLSVETSDAHHMVRRLAREEGLLVGVSAGAAAAAALRVAEDLEEGVVVAIFPDSAAKYLGEEFWGEA